MPKAQIVLRAIYILIIGSSLFGSIYILNNRVTDISLSQMIQMVSTVTVAHPEVPTCSMTLRIDAKTQMILTRQDIWDAMRACAENERENSHNVPKTYYFDI